MWRNEKKVIGGVCVCVCVFATCATEEREDSLSIGDAAAVSIGHGVSAILCIQWELYIAYTHQQSLRRLLVAAVSAVSAEYTRYWSIWTIWKARILLRGIYWWAHYTNYPSLHCFVLCVSTVSNKIKFITCNENGKLRIQIIHCEQFGNHHFIAAEKQFLTYW